MIIFYNITINCKIMKVIELHNQKTFDKLIYLYIYNFNYKKNLIYYFFSTVQKIKYNFKLFYLNIKINLKLFLCETLC
jgi:hypothetical protein